MNALSLDQREIVANSLVQEIDYARDKVMDSHSVALDLLSERVQGETPSR
jgi:hypothetical protein